MRSEHKIGTAAGSEKVMEHGASVAADEGALSKGCHVFSDICLRRIWNWGNEVGVKDTAIPYICPVRASLVKIQEVTIQYRLVNTSPS